MGRTLGDREVGVIEGTCQVNAHERWDADENSLNEMVDLLREALSFSGRTHGRERILALELSNEQVAQRIIKIYEDILKA